MPLLCRGNPERCNLLPFLPQGFTQGGWLVCGNSHWPPPGGFFRYGEELAKFQKEQPSSGGNSVTQVISMDGKTILHKPAISIDGRIFP